MKNKEARKYPEFKQAARSELLSCQNPLAAIEPSENFADAMTKCSEILNKNDVDIVIEWRNEAVDQAWYVTVKFTKKGAFSEEKKFIPWLYKLTDLKLYFIDMMLHFL